MKILFLLLLLVSFSCGKKAQKKSSQAKQDVSGLYSAPKLTVNVYYEPGAEPYTTDELLPIQYFSLLQVNLEALFAGRSAVPEIIVPKTLSQMTLLPLSGDMSWTLEDVEALNQKHQLSSSGSTFNIYFLNGFAAESAGIIGFHISGTTTMAVFKDVIRGTGHGQLLGAVPKYVEQSTLIHEMGHALGLVNNGLPMKEDHHDAAHGAHCSNPDCVMFYTNEGTQGLVKFAKKVVESQNTVMFDAQCLKDSRSY